MGERVPQLLEKLSSLFGPATVWRYRNGFDRSDLRLPGGDTRYFSAIVRLPAGENIGRLFAIRVDRIRILPSVMEADRGAQTVTPVILDLGGSISKFDLNALAERLEACLDAAFPDWRRRPGYRIELGEPLAAETVAVGPPWKAPAWMPDPALVGGRPRAIVAIIDDGIPFAHRAFRDASGKKTRVEFCWLQGASAGGSLPLGREYVRGEIDALIAQHGDDEDVLYHQAGATTPHYAYGASIGRFGTHGSHVAGLAAGDPAEADSETVRIIAVQLASAVTLDTTGRNALPAVKAAFEQIIKYAEKIEQGYDCPGLPLVINFSYGYTGGPHDGSGVLASHIRQLIDQRAKPTALVLPAGNTFQSALNLRVEPETKHPDRLQKTIPWRIQANDRTGSPLELWFAPGAALSALELNIIDPTGFTAASLIQGELIDPSAQFEVRNRDGEVVGRLYRNDAGSRPCLVLELVPSETSGGEPQAEAGLWRIDLRSDQAMALRGGIDCRLQRDFDPMNHYQGARQSYFDTGEELFDDTGVLKRDDDPKALLRRYGTLNDLATDAVHTIVVGAAYEDRDTPAPYSSAGPVNGAEPTVDCLVPAESRVLEGQRGIGTRSGATFRLSGTSTAAPRVTRAIADVYRELRAGGIIPAYLELGPVNALEAGLRPRAYVDGQTKSRSGRFGFEPKPPQA